jgi:hypothetical protein
MTGSMIGWNVWKKFYAFFFGVKREIGLRDACIFTVKTKYDLTILNILSILVDGIWGYVEIK